MSAATRDRVRILMYHRFPAVSRLDAQCAWLASAYKPVSLTEVAAWSRGEHQLPSRAIAITVDDGYRDFFSIGAPVFRKHGIPVTLFLTTDLPDRKGWLWTDQVRYLIAAARVESVSLDLDHTHIDLPLDSAAGRRNSVERLVAGLKVAPDSERLDALQRLPGLLDAELPATPPPDYEPPDWNDVRAAIANGVEVGAHTRTHPILSRLPDTKAIESEVAGSKARIEAETRRQVRHFCYPNGRWIDVGEKVHEAVARAGFESAVLAQAGLNTRNVDRFRLLRIPADPLFDGPKFAIRVANPALL